MRSRLATVAAVVVLTAGGLAGTSPVGATDTDDLEDQREEVQSQQDSLSGQMDALEATEAQVTARMADLSRQVTLQEQLRTEAQRAVENANHDAELAWQAEQLKVAEVEALEQLVRDLAVEAFVNPTGQSGFSVLSAEDPTEMAQKQALLDYQARDELALADSLETARQDLEAQRAAALEAAEVAEQRREAVQTQIDALDVAYSEQEAFADDVANRIAANLSESAGLQALDAQLAAEIQAEQARLQAELARQREAAAARNRVTPTPRPAGTGSSPGPVGNVSLTTVGGITVASSIAGQLESLLAAAAADGLTFGGGGYRDSSSQIALRQAHCGTSPYAIWEMSPSQCSPPTARPGESMHERGLAIDFTCGGSAIRSRSSPCFQWLASNAASYGLYNLPSEPWHWSVNGN